MSEAIAIRARRQGEDERCPYCHDLVAPGEQPAAMVTCPGCATAHHAECVAELGRCTVLGCERPLEAPAGVASDSSLRHEVRRRHGERAREFVARNASRVPQVDPEAQFAKLSAALRALSRASGRARIDALDRLVAVEEELGGGEDRLDLEGWLPLGQAHAERRRLEWELTRAAHRAREVPEATPGISPALVQAIGRASMVFFLVVAIGLWLLATFR